MRKRIVFSFVAACLVALMASPVVSAADTPIRLNGYVAVDIDIRDCGYDDYESPYKAPGVGVSSFQPVRVYVSHPDTSSAGGHEYSVTICVQP